MLIVEGPDGSGKTTLIEQFKTRFSLEVAPRVVSENAEAMVDLKRWVEENLAQGWVNKIFDRHRLISEPIYGPILRHNQEPGFTDPVWMANRMSEFYALEPYIIYCLPPLDIVRENAYRTGQPPKILHKIDAIYAAYVARAAIDTCNGSLVLTWDYINDATDDDGSPIWIDYVGSRMKKRRENR